jgi:hypothetical protein
MHLKWYKSFTTNQAQLNINGKKKQTVFKKRVGFPVLHSDFKKGKPTCNVKPPKLWVFNFVSTCDEQRIHLRRGSCEDTVPVARSTKTSVSCQENVKHFDHLFIIIYTYINICIPVFNANDNVKLCREPPDHGANGGITHTHIVPRWCCQDRNEQRECQASERKPTPQKLNLGRNPTAAHPTLAD